MNTITKLNCIHLQLTLELTDGSLTRPLLNKHPPPLSLELIELIAKHLFETRAPSSIAKAPKDDICCSKPLWSDVRGFMSASPELHRMGYRYWATVLTIRQSQDWDEALNLVFFVRELRCDDGAFATNHREVLSLFPKLCAASIDCHSDVKSNASNRFFYRNVFTKLPGSLRRLQVKHAHGPDINVISTVKKCCPDLEELWLGRCTMFNRALACQFWQTFPFDHNSYFSDQGTDAYTHSLGQELAPLRNLIVVRLGVYLMPSDVVLAHRVFHSRGLAAPNEIGWQQALQFAAQHQPAYVAAQQSPPQVQDLVALLHASSAAEGDFSRDSCRFCHEHSYAAAQGAKESANYILKQVIPSLERSEWMDWFTPGHLGVSVHHYKRVDPLDTKIQTFLK